MPCSCQNDRENFEMPYFLNQTHGMYHQIVNHPAFKVVLIYLLFFFLSTKGYMQHLNQQQLLIWSIAAAIGVYFIHGQF